MKIAVISFLNERMQFCAKDVKKVIDKLSGYNIYADRVIYVRDGDYKKVLEEVISEFDSAVILTGGRENLQAVMPFQFVDGIYKTDNFFCIYANGSDCIDEVYIPYVKRVINNSYGKVTFKVFGLNEETLENFITEAKLRCEGVDFKYFGKNLDYKLEIIYDEKSTKMEYDVAQKFTLEKLGKNIYAERDVSLEEQLVDLLKLRKCKLACAESFTGGNVARKVVSISGASEVFYEGIVSYSENSKSERLFVEQASLSKYKPVSSQVAGEMVKGLISTGKVNIAISTTGIAGPNSDSSEFPVGLCFIGIAVGGSIKVYKYNFDGDRNTVIDKGTNTALFLAVKAIKDF